jgi:hypothetical protein
MLMLVIALTAILVGRSDAEPQATLSVEAQSDANSSLGVRVKEQPGYTITDQVLSATQGKVELKPNRAGHDGQGTVNYNVTPRAQGGKVTWNAQTHEKVEGKDAVKMVQAPYFPAMPVPPMPMVPPGFPPQMKMEFPIPPMPFQPPAPMYFPAMPPMPPMPSMPTPPGFPEIPPIPTPPPMPQMPAMPSFPPSMTVPQMPQMAMPNYPVIPDTARGITSSTSEGEVDYHPSADGRSKGLSWSSKSESSTNVTWPPKAEKKSGKAKTK